MPRLKPNGKRVNGRGGGWIVPARRLALYLRDRFRCLYCDRDLTHASPRDVTLDHLAPRVRGKGSRLHASRNLVTACFDCNSKRQHRPWREFAAAVGGAAAIRRVRNATRRAVPLPLARALLAERRGGRATGDVPASPVPHHDAL